MAECAHADPCVAIQATESTGIVDSTFSNHYTSATGTGFIRGAYHFAHPSASSGATQANFFLAHGGGWSGDGITLPGMVDMESGGCCGSSECWGLSQAQMVSWIADFSNTYKAKTGRPPMIYTSPSWWSTCTGNSAAFHTDNPLVEAEWGPSASPMGGWPYESFWQYADTYTYGGDADRWNGDLAGLQKFAKGG